MSRRSIDLLWARKLDRDNVVGGLTSSRQSTTAQTSLVHRAGVLFVLGHVILGRLEVKKRHLVIELVWVLIVDALLVAVVASTVHEQAVDEDTILWLLLHLVGLFELEALEGEGKLINSDLVLTSVGLKDARKEALREEHAADPVGVGVATGEPGV